MCIWICVCVCGPFKFEDQCNELYSGIPAEGNQPDFPSTPLEWAEENPYIENLDDDDDDDYLPEELQGAPKKQKKASGLGKKKTKEWCLHWYKGTSCQS